MRNMWCESGFYDICLSGLGVGGAGALLESVLQYMCRGSANGGFVMSSSAMLANSAGGKKKEGESQTQQNNEWKWLQAASMFIQLL